MFRLLRSINRTFLYCNCLLRLFFVSSIEKKKQHVILFSLEFRDDKIHFDVLKMFFSSSSYLSFFRCPKTVIIGGQSLPPNRPYHSESRNLIKNTNTIFLRRLIRVMTNERKMSTLTSFIFSYACTYTMLFSLMDMCIHKILIYFRGTTSNVNIN